MTMWFTNNCSDNGHGKKGHKIKHNSLNNPLLSNGNPDPNCGCKMRAACTTTMESCGRCVQNLFEGIHSNSCPGYMCLLGTFPVCRGLVGWLQLCTYLPAAAAAVSAQCWGKENCAILIFPWDLEKIRNQGKGKLLAGFWFPFLEAGDKDWLHGTNCTWKGQFMQPVLSAAWMVNQHSPRVL